MSITVGTFNVNNLFSRYNFSGEVRAIAAGETEVDARLTYTFAGPHDYALRTYEGRLVEGKPAAEREAVAERIKTMDLDALAVQEVEDIGTLRHFADHDLRGLYPYQVLVEGNDPRLIDLGLLSKLPLGAVTSWQHAVHPDNLHEPIFSRDLLEVDVLDKARRRTLFTLYSTHLKSHFVRWNEPDKEAARGRADRRRQQQAEVIAQIVQTRRRPEHPYLIVGDMNDPPTSEWLAPLTASPELGLVDALSDPRETRPPKLDTPMPSTAAWTHRFKEPGQPARYDLYDQIWLSPTLAPRQRGAHIDRRTKHGGDGPRLG